MIQQRALIAVVDDDESIRESLPELLHLLGFAARPFVSAEAFLKSDAIPATQCLILDISMPGMSGPQLQRELKSRKLHIPIIFITAHADRSVRASLIAEGAIDCLIKPFSEQALRSALDGALGSA